MMSMSEGPTRSRPAALTILIVTEVTFAIVGFGSAFGLLSSPSGEGMGLSLDLLDSTPVGDFTLVGLFFLVFYGILPTVAAYGLITGRRWRWTNAVNKWTGQHWAWTASVALGMILLMWIAVELRMLGFLNGIGGALQVIMTVVGIWILALAMLPSVRSALKSKD